MLNVIMNPDNNNQQTDNQNLQKLEQDLEKLTKEAASTVQAETQNQTEVSPTQPFQTQEGSIRQTQVQQETQTQPTQPVTIPQTPPNLPVENNTKGKSFSLVTVAILLLVGAIIIVIGYVVFTKFTTPQTVKEVSTPTPVATPTLEPTPQATESGTIESIENWKTYTNTKYNYSIKYPPDWVYREFPDINTGAAFRLSSYPNDLNNEHIVINYIKRGLDDVDIPFETYVKNAAVREIQSYESLATIKPIETSGGLVGYTTTWNVQEWDKPIGKTKVSLPITYFDTKDSNGGTIQITESDSQYTNIYNQILSTFEFVSATPSATLQ